MARRVLSAEKALMEVNQCDLSETESDDDEKCFTVKGALSNKIIRKITQIRKSQFFGFFLLKYEKTHKKHLKTWKGNDLVKKKFGPVEKFLVKKIGPQRVRLISL